MTCEAVDVRGVPNRILLAPWGRVTSTAGDFVFDLASAQLVQSAFKAHGTDLPIDYEHQTVGGQFSSPDGKAPAAGWITQLEAVPGEGLYGLVNWTAKGREMIAAREYRYISPVIIRRDTDMRATVLLSAALTNTPAIDRMKAIVNKAKNGAGEPAPKKVSSLKEKAMDLQTLMQQLKEILTLQDASAEEKLAKVAELASKISSGELPPAEGAALIEAATGVAEAVGGNEGEQMTSSLKAKDYAKAGQQLLACVHGLCKQTAAGGPEVIAALRKELDEVKTTMAGQECESVLLAHKGKVVPAKEQWFRSWFKADRKAATEWIEGAPQTVLTHSVNAAASGNNGTAKPDRTVLVNKARSEFATESETRIVLCSERAWINNSLRSAGQQTLSDEETKALAIASE